MRGSLVRILGFVLVVCPAFAQEAEPKTKKLEKEKLQVLTIGDPAPTLDVGEWIKGSAIHGFERGKTYVVDFWATWCGPCKEAIPHMAEIQKEYRDKGVTVLGVSIWENDPDAVRTFVDDQGDAMAYTVATDVVPEGEAKHVERSQKGKMAQAWMDKAIRGGIPSVFIVNGEGNIAWIGHPRQGMDEALEGIVAGEYDIAQARREYEREQEPIRVQVLAGREFRAAMKEKDFHRAVKAALTAKDANLLNEAAWGIVDPEGDVENKDLRLAMKAAQRAVELTEEKDGMILDTLARVHFLKGDIEKAVHLQEKAVELSPASYKEQLQASLDEYRNAKKENDK